MITTENIQHRYSDLFQSVKGCGVENVLGVFEYKTQNKSNYSHNETHDNIP